jgi:hypothetical protein
MIRQATEHKMLAAPLENKAGAPAHYGCARRGQTPRGIARAALTPREKGGGSYFHRLGGTTTFQDGTSGTTAFRVSP